MIIFFSYFYTAVVFNPQETADNLKKYGGFIPGIRPGTATADYFDTVLTRLTTVGAIYVAIVCLLPEILISHYGVPFYFGGTSLMIVVSVTMDTVTQVQSHLLAHQYEGLIRKARVRGRGRDEAHPPRAAGGGEGHAGEAARAALRDRADLDGRHAAGRGGGRQRDRPAGAGDHGGRAARLGRHHHPHAGEPGGPAGLPQRLHPGRLPAHRAAGRGARPDARRRRAWRSMR